VAWSSGEITSPEAIRENHLLCSNSKILFAHFSDTKQHGNSSYEDTNKKVNCFNADIINIHSNLRGIVTI